MSFQHSLQLQNTIDKVISDFCLDIHRKHPTISHKELLAIWSGSSGSVASETPSVASEPLEKEEEKKVENDELSFENLIKYTKPELSALCKKYGQKCSGNKEQLKDRLTSVRDAKKEGKEVPTTKKKASKTKKTKAPKHPVIEKIAKNNETLNLRKNEHGNICHPSTNLVFEEKIAVGTQNDDGSVDPLTEEDIENCKKFKFQYQIPDNLDQNTLDDEEVEELDEEDLTEIEEEEDIEEEELIESEEELEDEEFDEDFEEEEASE